MIRKTLLSALALALFASASAQSVSEQAEKDEIVYMSDSNSAMQRAFAKAASTLDSFLRKNKNPPAGTRDFAVKVGIRDKGNTEYFWLLDVEQLSNGFVGTIANTPRMVFTVEEGQRYIFKRDDIADWSYIDENQRRMVGNFTMCALLSGETAAKREETISSYGLDCSGIL